MIPRVKVERKFESNILGKNFDEDAVARISKILPQSVTTHKYDSLALVN